MARQRIGDSEDRARFQEGDDFGPPPPPPGGGGTKPRQPPITSVPEDPLAEAIGRTLIDANTGIAGILQARLDRRTGRRVYWLSTTGGRAFSVRPDSLLVDPATRESYQVGAGGAETGAGFIQPGVTSGKLSEADLARLFGLDGGGGGGGGSSFAEQQALLRERQAFESAESEKDRRFKALQGRISALQDMINTFLQNQQSAREMKFGLREDPFALAAALQGQALQGVTPVQQFAQELEAFANQPAPQVGASPTLEEVNAAISGLQQQQLPQPQGFAGGGSVSPGPTVRFGGTGFGVMTGDRSMNGDEEIIHFDDEGNFLEVIPLAGGAQGGASVEQALAPLYESLGLPYVPKVTGSGGAHFLTSGASLLPSLGVRPAFVRDITSGAIYSTEGGQLRHVPSSDYLKDVGTGSILDLLPTELSAFGRSSGEVYTGPSAARRKPTFQASSLPRVDPTTQMILPEAFRIAGTLIRLRRSDPDLYAAMLSAFGRGVLPGGSPFGISPEQIQAQVSAATPGGVLRGRGGLR